LGRLTGGRRGDVGASWRRRKLVSSTSSKRLVGGGLVAPGQSGGLAVVYGESVARELEQERGGAQEDVWGFRRVV
jgi:hypothetical protein